jgi:hypothetical protein
MMTCGVGKLMRNDLTSEAIISLPSLETHTTRRLNQINWPKSIAGLTLSGSS